MSLLRLQVKRGGALDWGKGKDTSQIIVKQNMTFGPKPIPVLTRTNLSQFWCSKKKESIVQCDQIWQNLTMTLKNFGHFERVQIVFGKVLSLCTLANFICYWVNSLSWKWQNIKNNLAIWSHCYCLLPPLFRCRCCCWEPSSNLPKTLKISIKIEHSVDRRQWAVIKFLSARY